MILNIHAERVAGQGESIVRDAELKVRPVEEMDRAMEEGTGF